LAHCRQAPHELVVKRCELVGQESIPGRGLLAVSGCRSVAVVAVSPWVVELRGTTFQRLIAAEVDRQTTSPPNVVPPCIMLPMSTPPERANPFG
jgi:hypothetical protein